MNPTFSSRRFTSRQKQEAIELWPSEGLSCHATAKQLKAPRTYLMMFAFLLPTCAWGQFMWAESFRRALAASR